MNPEDVLRHEGLIYWFLKRYGVRRKDWNDLVQVCWVTLLKCAASHEPSKGTFATYATLSMGYAVLGWWKTERKFRERKWKLHKGRTVIHKTKLFSELGYSFQLGLSSSFAAVPDHADGILTEADCSWVVRKLEKRMRSRDWKIVWARYAEGLTLMEIGKLFKISQSRVNQIERCGIRNAHHVLEQECGRWVRECYPE